MLIVIARISATAEAIDALTPAIAAMEAASREEPGCHEYTFCRELNEPNTIKIVEQWESADALKAHFAMPHMATFQAEMGKHDLGGVEVRAFEASEVPFPPA
ncbi:MAG: putative quinol monooxygenase [Pseudomonadota bacterium]